MKKLIGCLLSLWLVGCTTQTPPVTPKISFDQAKSSFSSQNYPLAFRQMMPFAVKGYKDAEYAVGYMYYHGYGVKQNEEIGMNWLRRAAKKGQTMAQTTLAQR